MGSRGNDPFNFDDIYKQAGVDNLFVKKSMADMKKPAPAPPAKPVETVRPAPKDNIPASYAPVMSSRPEPTPVAAPKSTSGDPFASLNVVSSSNKPMGVQRPKETPSSAVAFDPFSGTGAISKPAPAAAPVSTATFDLDDMFGTSKPAAPKPTASAASFGDPFAAFDTVEGALPIETQQPKSASRPQSSNSLLDLDDDFAGSKPFNPPAAQNKPSPPPPRPSPPAYQQPSSAPATPNYSPAPSPRTEAPPPPPAYSTATNGPPSPIRRRTSDSDVDLHRRSSGLNEDAPRPPSYYDMNVERRSSDGSSYLADNRVGSGSGAAGKSGLKGVLKIGAALGKKAFRAAKEGLQSVESYLERMEGDGRTKSNGQPGSQWQDAASNFSQEEIEALAIRITEMPSNKQEDALAQLPIDVRRRIVELIRAQALADGSTAPTAAFGASAARPRSKRREDIIRTHEYKPNLDDSSDDEPEQAPPLHPSVQPIRMVIHPAPVRPAKQAPTAAPAPAPVEDDLLGISSDPTPASSAPKPAATAPKSAAPASKPVAPEDDLLGFGAASTPASAPAPAAPRAAAPVAKPAPKVASVDDVTDFFAGSSSSASTAAPSRPAAQKPATVDDVSDFFSGGASSTAPKRTSGAGSSSGLDALSGMGGMSGFADDGDEPVDENEPEIRKQLRMKRLAERAARMQAAVAEKQAKEEEEDRRKAEQVALKERIGEPVMAWKNKSKGNIRGLIGSLNTVLWEGSGWKQVGMGDLLEPNQVRKAWMKANLIVHPDKVKARGGTAEQIALADMIFDVLKEAMGQFK